MTHLKKPKTLTFSECTLAKLDKLFEQDEVFDSSMLDDWLNQHVMVTEFETQTITHLQHQLNLNVKHWNEAELLQNFIAPLFALVDFSSDKRFSLFAERRLSGVVDGITLSGDPDGMIASGFREPEQPYFSFQEHKRHRDPQGDPAGQALAAMLVGQAKNEQRHPIYGCHVIGANWYFMILHKKQYAISSAYVATKAEVVAILRALKAIKSIIVDLIEANLAMGIN